MSQKIIILISAIILLSAIPDYIFGHEPFTPIEKITVSEKKGSALFDSVLTIPEKYKEIEPGGDLVVQLKLYNFDSPERVDVFAYYEIKDRNNNVILVAHETVAVETQASFLKTFILPEKLSHGRYTVSSKIVYNQSDIATSAVTFDIVEPTINGGYQSAVLPFYLSPKFFVNLAFLSLVLIFIIVLVDVFLKKQKGVSQVTYQKKPGYKEVIQVIISSNKFFWGQKAIKQANRIKGLKVSEDGKVIELKQDPEFVLANLIDIYRISIGESSAKMAKIAIQPLIVNNPNLKIPQELI